MDIRSFSKIWIIIVVVVIVAGGIFAWQYLRVPMVETTWTQSTDDDFRAGLFSLAEITGKGSDAGIVLVSGVISQITAGGSKTLAIKTDGTLWAWGDNVYGQLGLSDKTNRSSPAQLGTDTDWKSVTAGVWHTLAIKTDGTLWAWGNNLGGQLGLGDSGVFTDRSFPTQVGTDTDWKSTAARNYNVAIKDDGTLWRLRTLPTQVGTDSDWKLVTTGAIYTLAIKTDGTLYAWGWNSRGQLGLGDTESRNSPTQVGTDTDWQAVVAGNYHSLAIKTDGTLWAWGYNWSGELGLGDNNTRYYPTQVGVEANWASVITGSLHTLAIKTDGTLWGWGHNYRGQLGLGDKTNRSSSTQLGTDTDWSSVIAGGNHTLAIKTDGTLWGWGYNWDGQLGLGDNISHSSPVLVMLFPYSSPGIFTSQVLDTKKAGSVCDELNWTATLPDNADIKFEVRASDTSFTRDGLIPAWRSVSDLSPVITGLPSGRHMQWRATLFTADPDITPVLHEVNITYTP